MILSMRCQSQVLNLTESTRYLSYVLNNQTCTKKYSLSAFSDLTANRNDTTAIEAQLLEKDDVIQRQAATILSLTKKVEEQALIIKAQSVLKNDEIIADHRDEVEENNESSSSSVPNFEVLEANNDAANAASNAAAVRN